MAHGSRCMTAGTCLPTGGADSVRGYLESEVLGDRGLSLGAEWRSQPFWKGESGLDEVRFLAFLEGGRAWVVDPLPAQVDRYSLAGAGLGLRLKARNGLAAALDFARPLQDAGRTLAGDNRFHARLSYTF